MTNENNTYFFGGAGDPNISFFEIGKKVGDYTETVRQKINGEGVKGISIYNLMINLENKITEAKEKELSQ